MEGLNSAGFVLLVTLVVATFAVSAWFLIALTVMAIMLHIAAIFGK